jgi:hypothetical protein
LGTATSYGTADIDDSEEKQLAAAFIWRGEEANHKNVLLPIIIT